jgi:hypothetical protein
MDALMGGLGFGEEEGGYIAQGGDIGSFVARVLAVKMGACRGVHCEFSWDSFLLLLLPRYVSKAWFLADWRLDLLTSYSQ